MSITRRQKPAATDGDANRALGCHRARLWHRIGRGALVVAAGTAALALAGPFALRPFVDTAQAAGTAGEVSVAFVLDFGGSSSNQVIGCVTVPTSDSRYQALSAFVQQEGLAQPSYAGSGLLCSINGVPSSGCGQVVGGGYVYWSYFTGTTQGWAYSPTGASSPVTAGDIEGWRFQDPGAGNPSDPPPRSPARSSVSCGSSPTTPTTPAVGSGGSGGSGGTGSGGGTGDTAAPQTPASQAVAAGAGRGAAGSSTTTTVPSSSSSSTDATTPSSSSDTPPPVASSSSAGKPTHPEVGLANARHARPGSGGGSPAPLVIGGLLIAALAIAAYVRWRKRPSTP
jgi:hypothetical protein